MTCRDCLHERVCLALIEKGLPWVDGEYPAEAFCMTFKNKTDFVEVVRCCDCKCCEQCYPAKAIGEEAIVGWYCKILNKHMQPDDFCSYGKRRNT